MKHKVPKDREPVIRDGLGYILLNDGAIATFSPEDYELIRSYSLMWFHHMRKYVACKHQGKRVFLHRVLYPMWKEVDHRDRNRLNNQRENLRECTTQQNIRNSGNRRNGTSKYKGVYKRGDRELWRATITVDGKRKGLGHFKTETDAARAYDKAATRLFGEFAYLNFPKGAPQ